MKPPSLIVASRSTVARSRRLGELQAVGEHRAPPPAGATRSCSACRARASVSSACSMSWSASSKSPRIACSTASARTVHAIDTGIADTCSRNPSQRRIASSTGVGPRTAAAARQPMASNSSSSSPARAAYSAALLHAASASAIWPARPGDVGAQRPQPRPAAVVVLVLEQRQDRVRDALGLLGAVARVGLEAHELSLDLRARPQRRVAHGGDRLVEHLRGLGHPPRREAARPRARAAAPRGRTVGRDERRRALQQLARRARVAAPQRAARGGLEARDRPRGQRALALAVATELARQHGRLLEVIADDLVLCRAARATRPRRRGDPRAGASGSPCTRPRGSARA